MLGISKHNAALQNQVATYSKQSFTTETTSHGQIGRHTADLHTQLMFAI